MTALTHNPVTVRLSPLLDRAMRVPPVVLLAPLLGIYVLACVAAPATFTDRSDEAAYIGYADRLSHGNYAIHGGLDTDFLWYGPGLPGLLAPLVRMGLPIEVIRLVGPLLLFAMVLLFRRLALLFVGERTAMLATLAVGLYLPLWRVLPRVYSEPLALLLIVAAAYLGVRAMRERSLPMTVGAGLALGWLALTRSEYGWVLIVMLVLCGAWALLKRSDHVPRYTAAMCAVGLLACVPWLAYTHHETGKAPYWGNSGGLSLYWMGSPESEDLGEPHTVAEVMSNPDLAAHRPFFRSIENLGPVEKDAALRKRAREQIKDDPVQYGRNLAANFSRLWIRWPYSFETVSAKTLGYVLPGLLLFGVVLLTAWRFLRRRARLPKELWPFALLAAGGFGIHLLAAGYPRSIWPLVPLFALGAAIAFGPRGRPEAPRG